MLVGYAESVTLGLLGLVCYFYFGVLLIYYFVAGLCDLVVVIVLVCVYWLFGCESCLLRDICICVCIELVCFVVSCLRVGVVIVVWAWWLIDSLCVTLYFNSKVLYCYLIICILLRVDLIWYGSYWFDLLLRSGLLACWYWLFVRFDNLCCLGPLWFAFCGDLVVLLFVGTFTNYFGGCLFLFVRCDLRMLHDGYSVLVSWCLLVPDTLAVAGLRFCCWLLVLLLYVLCCTVLMFWDYGCFTVVWLFVMFDCFDV